MIVPEGEITPEVARELVEAFLALYERIYGKGTAIREAGIELNTLRVEGRVPVATSAPVRDEGEAPEAGPVGSRRVIFAGGGEHDVPVYRGEEVGPGSAMEGPVILEFAGTTVVVEPGQSLRVDSHRNVIVNCEAGE